MRRLLKANRRADRKRLPKRHTEGNQEAIVMSVKLEKEKKNGLCEGAETPAQALNYTYILCCADQTYYCGWTNNLARRLKAHNEGSASRYTRARLPVRLVYYEAHETKREAMQREASIKALGRRQKEDLIRSFEQRNEDIV